MVGAHAEGMMRMSSINYIRDARLRGRLLKINKEKMNYS